MRTTTIFAETHTSERANHVAYRLVIIIIIVWLRWIFTDLVCTFCSKFNVQRVTANLKVAYYVKSDFSTSFKGSLQHLEQQIEEDHVSYLKANCLNEKSYREFLILL